MKREGSVAIVPLFLAVMLLFWFIAFMGGANDTLHSVNNVENLQHLQKKLLVSAMRYRYHLEQEARDAGVSLTDEQIDLQVNAYINEIMVLNKIQE
jgi:hypothetical protein